MAKKTLFWTITSFLISIIVYILTVTVIMPVLTRNPLPDTPISKVTVKVDKSEKNQEKPQSQAKKSVKGEKGSKKSETKNLEQVADETVTVGSKVDQLVLFELKKTENLLRSQYNLATEDSMYLVLDLIDKIACIELKGIPLHRSKIVDFTLSNSIKMFHNEQLLHWIGQPFMLRNAISTIARVPIAVVNAPKDTIEANSNSVLPSAPVREDVYLILNFDRNLQLIIQQAEIGEGKSRVDSLKLSYKNKEIDKTIKSLITFKRELVMPKILITLKKSDATILYRALPLKPKMVLRM